MTLTIWTIHTFKAAVSFGFKHGSYRSLTARWKQLLIQHPQLLHKWLQWMVTRVTQIYTCSH